VEPRPRPRYRPGEDACPELTRRLLSVGAHLHGDSTEEGRRADIALQRGGRVELDASRLEVRTDAGERARRGTTCLARLVDADAQSEEALIVALAVEVAGRIAVLAGEQSRGRWRPGPVDMQDDVAVTPGWPTTGHHGGEGTGCERDRQCERGRDPHRRFDPLPMDHVASGGWGHAEDSVVAIRHARSAVHDHPSRHQSPGQVSLLGTLPVVQRDDSVSTDVNG